MLLKFALAKTGTVSTSQPAQSETLYKVFALTLVAIILVSAGNLLDPFLGYDDFPALFAEPDGFWFKTLTEGRWLNYFWHLRVIVTPAWLNFVIYQATWALFAAAFAVVVIPGRERIWFACVLALTILVAPPALVMSPWFNTLFPGTALLATYAVLATRLSQFALRAILPVFTLLSFTAYTTFPIILLLICLVRTEHRSLMDLARLVLMFGASFVASLLAVYALNWQVHGVFGVVLDPSRGPTPATDLSTLMDNFQLLIDTLVAFLEKTSFNSRATMGFHLGMFCAATVVLFRRASFETLYLYVGFGTGMALVAVQVLKMGVPVPTRAFHFAWITYAVLIVRAAQELSHDTGIAGRLARNLVLLVTASYLLQTTLQFTNSRNWQAETRVIALQLAAVPGVVYAVGDIVNHPSALKAGVQQPIALSERIRQLIDRGVIICETSPDACSPLPAEWLTPVASATPKMRLEQWNGASVIVIPPRR